MLYCAFGKNYVSSHIHYRRHQDYLHNNNYFKKLLQNWSMVRVFANGPGDRGSIAGRDIPNTQKMVLDAALLNTQHYKVRIKGKVGQSWERSRAPHTLVC